MRGALGSGGGGGLRARPPRTKALADGSVGYVVRAPRTDDCLPAAIATCLQVPIEDVPDPEIDRRLAAGESAEEIRVSTWEQLVEWLAERGLQIVVHGSFPRPAPERWIGVVRIDGAFNDHSMVMAGEEVLCDPTLDLGPVRIFGAGNVTSGFSFVPLETTS
jgi:hypothetical protein